MEKKLPYIKYITINKPNLHIETKTARKSNETKSKENDKNVRIFLFVVAAAVADD